MTQIFDRPITEPAAWTVADLESDRRWEVTLADAEVGDLLAACAGAKAQGLELAHITAANFPLPHCRRTILRIREELRAGVAPQAAINVGYDRAWGTIFDSNITTLIAGLALLAFGSGPVRGFAVVHCLGILTSMFSGVFFSRGLVNFWYGRKARLKALSIGTVWRADTGTAIQAKQD